MEKVQDQTIINAAIVGTAVADASALGLHWIYSQGKIAQVVKGQDDVAEFLEPDRENYQGVPAFFAHPRKHAGDSSNYGHYLYVLLQSVSEEGFDRGRYVRCFQEYFGVGGAYVGYADGPMRETIYNLARIGKELEDAVLKVDSSLDDKKRRSAAHYISRYFFEFDTEGLKAQVRTPLKLQQWNGEELDTVDRLIEEVSSTLGEIGPDDDQMPALSRSAILPFFYRGEELDRIVECAVRITNNNEDAVAYSRFLARILRELYEGATGAEPVEKLRELVDKHTSVLSEHARDLIRQAQEYKELDVRGATKTFGAACHVHMAVPLVLHLLLNTGSFTEVNRANIMASGDSCGRAVMLGAVAGALYGIGGERGIPESWIDRTRIIPELRRTEGGRLLMST